MEETPTIHHRYSVKPEADNNDIEMVKVLNQGITSPKSSMTNHIITSLTADNLVLDEVQAPSSTTYNMPQSKEKSSNHDTFDKAKQAKSQ